MIFMWYCRGLFHYLKRIIPKTFVKTCIIIPTYNERENIIPLITEIFRVMPMNTRILVVDDSSPDGTAELVRQYAARDSRVELMARPRKLGLGTAYQAAFRTVLDGGKDDVIITMDADFSHNPKYLPQLAKAAETHDLVIGSRYVRGGGVENWSTRRKALSFFGNLYARCISGAPIHDLTAGFSCMRTDFLRQVPFEKVRPKGYAWWIALKTYFYRKGARITELPIYFTERRAGRSKMSTNIIYEGLVEPWKIRFLKL